MVAVGGISPNRATSCDRAAWSATRNPGGCAGTLGEPRERSDGPSSEAGRGGEGTGAFLLKFCLDHFATFLYLNLENNTGHCVRRATSSTISGRGLVAENRKARTKITAPGREANGHRPDTDRE